MRIYDAEAPFDHQAVTRSLERAVLAPNSSNLQAWEFHRIHGEEMLFRAATACLNQRAARTAREMVAVVVRSDLWRRRRDWILKDWHATYPGAPPHRVAKMERYYRRLLPLVYRDDPFRLGALVRWIGTSVRGLLQPTQRITSACDVRIIGHKSAGIAAGFFMLSMTAEGYDTCPMEGFDRVRMKRLLGLPRKAEIAMVVACGPGTSKGIYTQRARLPMEEVVREYGG